MKLFYSPSSPFVRKVTIVAALRGLSDQIERVVTRPLESPAFLLAVNPLSRIPALLTDEGYTLIDSALICEYLDSMGTNETAPLFPPSGDARWQALHLQALAGGMMDAAVMLYLKRVRPEEEARQRDVIERTLDVLEGAADVLGSLSTIGDISVACALGWFDFRLPELEWRTGRYQLAAWFDGINCHPVMKASEPYALPPA